MFLAAICVIVSSAEGQEEQLINITLSQHPEKLCRGETVHFDWKIIQPIELPYAGKKYCFEIVDSDEKTVSGYPKKFDIEWRQVINKSESWIVPDEAPTGRYRATLTFPCINPRVSATAYFEVLHTLLVIQKLNVTNQDRVPLSGWEFNITYPNNTTISHTTNFDGEITIEDISGGYTIEEIMKPGWENITSSERTEDVKEGKTTRVEFLNARIPPGTLLIHKFNDSNRNGKQDENELGLANWNFTITRDEETVVIDKTNATGFLEVKLPSGTYVVNETLKENWTSTTLTSQKVNVTADQPSEVKFGNYYSPPTPPPTPIPIGNLTILKFYDSNQNKVQDPGEQGMTRNFYITYPNGTTTNVKTGAYGTYTLRNIRVGEYTLSEETKGCRWRNSTPTTQKVQVAGQKITAIFGNYIAPCSPPPGCPWLRSDENLTIIKSVDPCSVSLGREEEVTVYLTLCVDPVHVKHGREVKNISVIETLHNQFSIVEDSFSIPPKAKRINPDGSTTIEWDIPKLCCEEWNVFFKAKVSFSLPIDVSEEYERAVSKVIYEDPIEKIKREIPIPAGSLRFIVPTPIPTPSPTPTPTPKRVIPSFEAVFAIAGLLSVAYLVLRKKRK